MRKSMCLIAAAAMVAMTPVQASAQGPYAPPGHEQGRGPSDQGRGPPGGDQYRGQDQDQYYSRGRWVGPDQWRQDRQSWEDNYRRRHKKQKQDNTAAIIAGVIGLALGAAIVGSQDEARRARTPDTSRDGQCRAKYRSYDAPSGSYMGYDGFRHYCQLP